jgi:hypothetical protein
MKGRNGQLFNGTGILHITKTQLTIINCHYLAADLIELIHSAPFVEAGPAHQLSHSLTRWADKMTLMIENIHRVVDDRKSVDVPRSSARASCKLFTTTEPPLSRRPRS